eukprot:gene11509-8191_t
MATLATPPGSSSSSCRQRDDGDASPPTATRAASRSTSGYRCDLKEAMAKTRAKERHLLLHRTEAVL